MLNVLTPLSLSNALSLRLFSSVFHESGSGGVEGQEGGVEGQEGGRGEWEGLEGGGGAGEAVIQSGVFVKNSRVSPFPLLCVCVCVPARFAAF